jgi:electron transfer flavoprotein alpha subunit
MSILAVMEQRGGAWNRMSFETLAAAQHFAQELNTTASAAVLSDATEPLAAELASKQLEKVYAVEHPLLKDYSPEGSGARFHPEARDFAGRGRGERCGLAPHR